MALVLVLPFSACIYGFQAGAGCPDDVKTVAIIPFELGPNITRPELADEVFNLLLREFPRSQGLQPAGEDVADAVVRGVINRYDVSTPSYRAGPPGQAPTVLQRQVTLTVEELGDGFAGLMPLTPPCPHPYNAHVVSVVPVSESA